MCKFKFGWDRSVEVNYAFEHSNCAWILIINLFNSCRDHPGLQKEDILREDWVPQQAQGTENLWYRNRQTIEMSKGSWGHHPRELRAPSCETVEERRDPRVSRSSNWSHCQDLGEAGRAWKMQSGSSCKAEGEGGNIDQVSEGGGLKAERARHLQS